VEGGLDRSGQEIKKPRFDVLKEAVDALKRKEKIDGHECE